MTTDACFAGLPQGLRLTIPSLTVESHGTEGTTTATFTNVSGIIGFSGTDATCTYTGIDLLLSGTVALESRDADDTVTSTQASFNLINVVIAVEQYAERCVAVVYQMTVNGVIMFTSEMSSSSDNYRNYVLDNDATSGENMVGISGCIISTCLGGPVQFA